MRFWIASDEAISAGYGKNGWPLKTPRIATAIVAQFYDQQENTLGTNFAQTGGEQPISTLLAWISLYIIVDNHTYTPMVDAGEISEYSQNMSIRDGLVSTSLVWRGLRLNYTVLAHRTRPTLGIVRLEIESLIGSIEMIVTDMLDDAGSWRTTFNDSFSSASILQLISSVKPNGISNVSL